MHYSECKEGIFRFVVYKHGQWGGAEKIFHPLGKEPKLNKDMSNVQLEANYQLTSIQECRYIHPYDLWQFMQVAHSKKGFHRLMRKYLVAEAFEKWYLFTAKHVLGGGLEILGFEKVDNSPDPFMYLH